MKKVFCSYASKDFAAIEEFSAAFRLHPCAHEVDLWIAPRNLRRGSNWKNGVVNAIRTSDFGIAFLSRHYRASNFITNTELPALLKRHRAHGTFILQWCRLDDADIPKALSSIQTHPSGASIFPPADRLSLYRDLSRATLEHLDLTGGIRVMDAIEVLGKDLTRRINNKELCLMGRASCAEAAPVNEPDENEIRDVLNGKISVSVLKPDSRQTLLAALALLGKAIAESKGELSLRGTKISLYMPGTDSVPNEAIDVFGALFQTLPILQAHGVPWRMVEHLGSLKTGSGLPVWDAWWRHVLKDTPTSREIASAAPIVASLMRPTMNTDAAATSLRLLENAAHPIPSEPAETKDKFWDFYPRINDPRCTATFIQDIQSAKSSIALFGSDGFTYPDGVRVALCDQLRKGVAVSMFFPDLTTFREIETVWSIKDAEDKLRVAHRKLSDWIRELIRDSNPAERKVIRKKLNIYQVHSAVLAQLRGSLIVDERIIRLNVHAAGANSQSGFLIRVFRESNLVKLGTFMLRFLMVLGARRWTDVFPEEWK